MRGLADLDIETGDDAVDGGDDPRLAQLIIDLFELRLGLGQPFARGLQINPRQFQLVAHGIELFLAHQAALVQTAGARELPLEIFDADLLAFDIDGIQAHRSLRLFETGQEIAVVDAQYELFGFDPVRLPRRKFPPPCR